MIQPAAGDGRFFRATNRRVPCKTQSPASTAMLPRNVWTTCFRLTRRNMHIVQIKTRLLGVAFFGPSERTGTGRFPSTLEPSPGTEEEPPMKEIIASLLES